MPATTASRSSTLTAASSSTRCRNSTRATARFSRIDSRKRFDFSKVFVLEGSLFTKAQLSYSAIAHQC